MVLKKLKADSRKVLIVGDQELDVTTAQKVGCQNENMV